MYQPHSTKGNCLETNTFSFLRTFFFPFYSFPQETCSEPASGSQAFVFWTESTGEQTVGADVRVRTILNMASSPGGKGPLGVSTHLRAPKAEGNPQLAWLSWRPSWCHKQGKIREAGQGHAMYRPEHLNPSNRATGSSGRVLRASMA